MADKPEEQMSREEKLTSAKEVFGRATRNFAVRAYGDAADELSQVCSIYSTMLGPVADELGLPYLMYAKSLIALGQDENKLIDIPEEEEEEEEDEYGDDDDEDNADEEGEDNVEKKVEKEKLPKNDQADDDVKKGEDCKTKDLTDDGKKAKTENRDNEEITNEKNIEEKPEKECIRDKTETISMDKDNNASAVGIEKKESGSKQTNGHSNDEPDRLVAAIEPQPGTSAMNGHDDKKDTEEDEDDNAAANLQVAWEVLEFAVQIFERQGDAQLSNLAEAYTELAGISFENSHFEMAVKDFEHALEIYDRIPNTSRRIIAEIFYKIGLSHLMFNGCDESVAAFKQACAVLEKEMETEKAKIPQTEDIENTIKDLDETKQEIINKIIEIEESKKQSMEEVKSELSKLYSVDAKKNEGGPSSCKNSAVDSKAKSGSSGDNTLSNIKPNPTDISHLIKRKKPDSNAEVDCNPSPAKRPAN